MLIMYAEFLTALLVCASISEATATCQGVVCPLGEVCVMKQVMCIRAPCDPIPICEAPDAKPGTCPRVLLGDIGTCDNECVSDGECLGDRKCCSNGCGKICRHPILASPCPRSTNGPCIEQCRQDGDCRDGYSCCYNGCGHVCIQSIGGKFEKPGTCPWHFFHHQKHRCGQLCVSDLDCPGLDKCCRNGCGQSCQAPCFFRRQNSPGPTTRDSAWIMPYFCGRHWKR